MPPILFIIVKSKIYHYQSVDATDWGNFFVDKERMPLQIFDVEHFYYCPCLQAYVEDLVKSVGGLQNYLQIFDFIHFQERDVQFWVERFLSLKKLLLSCFIHFVDVLHFSKVKCLYH